jgi:hypothetical protein
MLLDVMNIKMGTVTCNNSYTYKATCGYELR